MGLVRHTMSCPEQAVLLCGGLGTRLRPHTDHLPKPMIPCNGKPFLWHLLRQLQEQGVQRFVLLTGYLGGKIEEYFSDGHAMGWDITYSRGPAEWDTGKRVWEARNLLNPRFLLLYSDNFVPFPLDKVLAKHEEHGRSLTFMVSPKTPGNIALDERGLVERYDKTRSTDGLDYVEIGYMVVERDAMLRYFEQPDCSFSQILMAMADNRDLSAWVQGDAYHSISDPERWKKAETYLSPKKLLLVDRDGVINRKAPRGEYVARWEDFEWIPETHEAMKELARQGFRFIIISNQAGIARGMVEPEELERIHRHMKEVYDGDGIQIVDIYVCPHHWDEGCWCRKPNPGMFFQAAKEHLFRLDQTLFIGDDPRDGEAAANAGCQSVLIAGNASGQSQPEASRDANWYSSLGEALPFIRAQIS